MTAADWISDRRALIDAATEGPWYWSNTSAPYLFGKRRLVVMAFERMGMQGAQPSFRDARNILIPAGKENINAFPDAALIADARTSLPAALDALEAVLELHPRREWTLMRDFAHFGQTEFPAQCPRCRVDYPCLTVAAITAALGIEVQP